MCVCAAVVNFGEKDRQLTFSEMSGEKLKILQKRRSSIQLFEMPYEETFDQLEGKNYDLTIPKLLHLLAFIGEPRIIVGFELHGFPYYIAQKALDLKIIV